MLCVILELSIVPVLVGLRPALCCDLREGPQSGIRSLCVSNLLEDYESYLTTEKKASANTVSSYLRDASVCPGDVRERDVPLDEVLPRDVEDYIRGLTRGANPLPR